ncbi:MAG: hypothetical protein U0821_17335 [Chloroflexota bacterium]
MAAWARLVALMAVAGATELVYVALWPLSYLLTQGLDFTTEYVTQYPWVWARHQELRAIFDLLWPAASQELGPAVDLLMGLFGAAFVLYLAGFALVSRGLPRHVGPGVLMGCLLGFQATLFLMPGLFTTDLFSYVAYGQIAGANRANPFIYPPAYFAHERVVGWIHPLWHFAPSIYGPAWVDVSAAVSEATTAWSTVDQVLAYKLIVNVSHLLGIAALAYAVQRLRPGAALASVYVWAWNPLVLFEFGGNGHNDAVMVALALAGFALFAAGAPLPGVLPVALSVLVKMSTVLLLPFYVMGYARSGRGLLSFLSRGTAAALLVVALAVGLYYPWWEGVETVGPIVNWTQGPMYNNYLPDILARYVAANYVLGPDQPDPVLALEQTREQTKLIAKAALAALCVIELAFASTATRAAAAGARVMLVFLLVVNTWVLPWYFTWSLALGAVVGWQSLLTKTIVGFSASAMLVMYYKHFWHPYMADTTYILYVLPLLIPIVGIAMGGLRTAITPRRASASPGLT